MVDEPHYLATVSALDVARRLKVSQPTVTRFAMALGYAGFAELQRTLRGHVAHAAQQPSARTDGNRYQQALETDARAMDALGSSLQDPRRLEEAGRLCWASSPLLVAGSRISAPLAHLFAHLGRRFHPQILAVQHLDSLAEEELHRGRSCGATTLLAFAYPRYDAALPGFLRMARGAGYRCVVVTDHTVVPFTTPEDLVLATGLGSELVFDSLAAAMSMVSLLLHAMYQAGGDQAQRRLEDFEEFAERTGLFIPPSYRSPTT